MRNVQPVILVLQARVRQGACFFFIRIFITSTNCLGKTCSISPWEAKHVCMRTQTYIQSNHTTECKKKKYKHRHGTFRFSSLQLPEFAMNSPNQYSGNCSEKIQVLLEVSVHISVPQQVSLSQATTINLKKKGMVGNG